MRAKIDISRGELAAFDARCNIALKNVNRGTWRATEAACQEIIAMSELEVPKDTWTMLSSAYYEISRRTDVGGHVFEAIVGYGGNGDPVNPRTGLRASEYMVKLHEDMNMPHANGKAKFLEDPVRAYAASEFYRTIFDYASESLASMSGK